MHEPEEQLSIGAVARRTGLSVHAIRFFEREELFLREIPRANGRRTYETADVEWLVLCNRLRASGMPLATIGRFAKLVREGPGNEGERLAILREHERAVEAQLADLSDCLGVIRTKVEIYEQLVDEGTAAGVWAPGSATPD